MTKIGYTCPDIDRAIKSIDEVQRYLFALGRDDVRDAFHYGDSIYEVVDILESLRKSNEGLRTWAEKSDEEWNEAQDTIRCLEEQIFELEKSIV